MDAESHTEEFTVESFESVPISMMSYTPRLSQSDWNISKILSLLRSAGERVVPTHHWRKIG